MVYKPHPALKGKGLAQLNDLLALLVGDTHTHISAFTLEVCFGTLVLFELKYECVGIPSSVSKVTLLPCPGWNHKPGSLTHKGWVFALPIEINV